MEREKIIEYLRKEVRCDKSKWSECSNYKRCVDCPNNFPVPLSKVIQAALELIEQDGWIPVTERLPEDEYVLISKKPTKLSGSKWSVAIAIRTADQRSGKIQWRDSGFGIIQDDKVLAWRPLPEPYTEKKYENYIQEFMSEDY